MREILFRGQTRRKGEKVRMDGTPVESNWVYGGIFPNNDGGDFAVIYQQEPEIKKFPVYADTVCQYTGLTDKNGKKIFEGDIVANKGKWGENIGVIVFKSGKFSVNWRIHNSYSDKGISLRTDDVSSGDEVIGNIFDNPDLITPKKGADV